MRPHDRDPLVTGPHDRINEQGERELYWQCHHCGRTSTDPSLQWGCPANDRGVGHRP